MTDYIGEPTRQTAPRSDQQETDLLGAMREVVRELRNMAKPPEVIAQITVPYTVQTRLRVRHFIIENVSAAGGAFGIVIGTKPYTFDLPAHTTLVVPLPFVIERGTDIGLVGDPVVYMVADLYMEPEAFKA